MKGETIMKKLIAILFSLISLIFPAYAVIDALGHPEGFVNQILSLSPLYIIPIVSLLFKIIAYSRGSILLSILALLCDLILMYIVFYAAVMVLAFGGVVEMIIIAAWFILGIVDLILVIPAAKS